MLMKEEMMLSPQELILPRQEPLQMQDEDQDLVSEVLREPLQL